MERYDGSVVIGVDMDTDPAKKSVQGLGDKLKGSIAAAAKAATVALGAAVAGVAALSTAAVNSYGEYEQLVGGVGTLFKDSADTVMGYAENAYKTAGLSANEYMTTVTSFSASLLQSLGGDTERAAQMADMAITDMSDNVNKMGSTMESVQNAYNGFAKQNFTMLDNLKLGYGGTKEEMERLLSDAEKLSGIEYDVSSYADIVSAIHVIQTEMGITGTTALEASTTIQGSISSMKSAWENLVTGLADDNADMSQLVGNVVESVKTVVQNIIPVLETALSSIGQMIAELAPVIGTELPGLIMQVLPSLLQAGIQLVQGVVQGIVTAFPKLQAAASEMFASFIGFLQENLPQMISSGLEALLSFSAGFRENMGALVDNAIELIMTLADGIIEALPDLIATVPEIISNFANAVNDNAPKLLKSAAELISKLVKGLIDNIPVIIQNIPKIITAIVDVFLAFNWLNLGKTLMTGLGNGLKGMVSVLKSIAKQLAEAIKGGFANLPQTMMGIGKNIVQGLWNGVKAMKDWVLGKIREFVGGIVGGIKNLLDNWYFADTINQRGQTEYTSAGYTIDRWSIEAGAKLKVLEDGVVFTPNPSKYNLFVQAIENYKDLIGKQLTLSVLIEENTCTNCVLWFYGGTADNIVITTMNGNDKLYSVTMTPKSNITSLRCGFQGRNSAGSVKILAVKLELGDQQTLAHQDASGSWVLNDPPPNKAQELLKCMRYQIAFDWYQENFVAGYGETTSTTTANAFLPIPTLMRTNPTISNTDGSIWNCIVNGNRANITSISMWFVSKNLIGMRLSGDFPMGASYPLITTYSSANKVIFDANL